MNTTRDTATVRANTLYARHIAIIEAVASERCEGNFSMALRAIVSHYASCQLPRLGIDVPSVEAAEAEGD